MFWFGKMNKQQTVIEALLDAAGKPLARQKDEAAPFFSDAHVFAQMRADEAFVSKALAPERIERLFPELENVGTSYAVQYCADMILRADLFLSLHHEKDGRLLASEQAVQASAQAFQRAADAICSLPCCDEISWEYFHELMDRPLLPEIVLGKETPISCPELEAYAQDVPRRHVPALRELVKELTISG